MKKTWWFRRSPEVDRVIPTWRFMAYEIRVTNWSLISCFSYLFWCFVPYIETKFTVTASKSPWQSDRNPIGSRVCPSFPIIFQGRTIQLWGVYSIFLQISWEPKGTPPNANTPKKAVFRDYEPLVFLPKAFIVALFLGGGTLRFTWKFTQKNQITNFGSWRAFPSIFLSHWGFSSYYQLQNVSL